MINIIKKCKTRVFITIITLVILSFILTACSTDEEIGVLQAGLDDIPIIQNDDLQELGELYSTLNDKFEREIDALVTGEANRHNKKNDRLMHYGVYGQDNLNPFKNNDYVNGAIIKYEKATASIADGASNFNDIISVMSILYDQMMDTVDITELKEVFEDIFWMSHTYTFDSSELYPCKHGCSSVDKYKCVDVYYDYSKSGHASNLQHDPFTVRKHDEYVDLGYEPDEDFRIVLPEGQCEVCGKSGAGCIWQENKVCYHGSGNISIASCETDANTIADVCFGEVGETYKAEDLEDEFISDDDSKGSKIAKTDNKCRYYKEIKFCNTRKNYANQIKSTKEQLASAEESASRHSENCNYDGDGECPTCKKNNEKIEELNEKIERLRSELDNHISTVCEKDETSSRFWCDGYKLCLGHKTHYTCPTHKLVCCFGHTNITVTIKILYKDELLDLAYKALS